MDPSIFEAAGGTVAIAALAAAWHRRCVEDEVVGHAFSHPGHPDHLARLTAYWSEALGGPDDYTHGVADHTFVLRLHAGNGQHEEMDERAQACFLQALDDAHLPEDPRLRSALRDWFRWATAGMAAYPDSPEDVPSALPLPRWSWNGQVGDSGRAGRQEG